MTYNEKRLIADYLQGNGYESDNGIKYVKRHPNGEAVISVTVLAVGNKEYIASLVGKTILHLSGKVAGSVELARSVECVGDIISVEENIGAQRDFMTKVLNNKMYRYEADTIQSQESR